MNLKVSYRMSLGWVLLLIWGAFMTLNAQFRHLHFDKHGNLISHSHYTGDSQDDHDHSEEDFYWLDMLSNPNFDEAYVFCPIVMAVRPENPSEISTNTPFFFQTAFIDTEARGPPQMI